MESNATEPAIAQNPPQNPIEQPVQPVQPVQQPVSSPSSSGKKGINPKFLILAFILVAVIIVGGLYYRNLLVKQQETVELVNKPATTSSPTTVPLKTEKTDSKLSPFDLTFNKYTNTKFGFSINIPKEAVIYNGGCKLNAETKTYGTNPDLVPIKVFEGDEYVKIAEEYSYKVEKDAGMGKCVKTEYTLESLLKNHPGWDIQTENVETEKDVLTFVKSIFGEGCSIKKMTPGLEGISDVEILGDGKDLAESKCPVNYVYAIKYSPGKKKIASWGIGQACAFSNDKSFNTCLDSQIVKSFRFE